MKTYLRKLGLFTAILLSLMVIDKFLTPYDIGNQLYQAKVKQSKTIDSLNLFIFGSSRMYRQVSPQVLDSMLKPLNISTYNFASGGAYNPESYYLLENYFKHKSYQARKYVLLELQPLHLYLKGNIRSLKGNYWNTLSMYNFSMSYIESSGFSESKKSVYVHNYRESFLYGLTKFYTINALSNSFRHMDESLIGYKGFFDIPETDFQFMKDTLLLYERIESAKLITKSYYDNQPFNHAHFDYLESLNARLKERNIILLYILPPRLSKESYEELIPVFNKLPIYQKIEIANFDEFSDLYKVTNSYDHGHLNRKGARIFSKYIAQKILRLSENTNE